jgi:hypothetical protein
MVGTEGTRFRHAATHRDRRECFMSGWFIFLCLFIPLVTAIGTAIFQWLWNITMTQVFDLRGITFWQAFRILLLASFIFGAQSLVTINLGR